MESKEWLIGVIAGDGIISDRYVRVYNSDINVIDKSRDVFQKRFGIPEFKIKTRIQKQNRKAFIRNKDVIEVTINSKRLSILISRLKKHLLQDPCREFVSGLFDAEGSIDLRGTITFWQKKDEHGQAVAESVRKWLSNCRIKFAEVKNAEFYIIEILGSYKNYQNLRKFLKLVNFVSEKKVKDSKLILDVFSKHKSISKLEVLNFAKSRDFITVRNVVETFHTPKMNAYTALNKLVRENKLIKTDSYPNRYIYPAGFLR